MRNRKYLQGNELLNIGHLRILLLTFTKQQKFAVHSPCPILKLQSSKAFLECFLCISGIF